VAVLVVKPARVGGIRAARRIAEVAAAGGVATVVSTLFESGVGIAAALHLAAAVPGEGRAHGLATADLLASDLLARPLPVRAGAMAVPRGPGLGVELDEVALDRYAVR
jgi:L-alanine-DL-glutamate epimerase-like enolase superfamily enzyme